MGGILLEVNKDMQASKMPSLLGKCPSPAPRALCCSLSASLERLNTSAGQ
jgi:hypothetical protein